MFDLVESKLRPPVARRGIVARTALVDRLVAASSPAVISVVAPAGYGKTTFLAQWAERKKPRVGWVSVDDRDNDPVVLLSLHRGGTGPHRGDRPEGVSCARLVRRRPRGSAVAGRRDGQDAAPGRARHRQLGSGHEPGESRRGRRAGTGTADGLAACHRFAGHVALADRAAARAGRHRGGRRDDLAMDKAEARSLLVGAGVELAEADLDDARRADRRLAGRPVPRRAGNQRGWRARRRRARR